MHFNSFILEFKLHVSETSEYQIDCVLCEVFANLAPACSKERKVFRPFETTLIKK